MTIYREAEKAAEFVKTMAVEGSSFELAIANDMTVAGQVDPIGVGMALIGDACLARGFEPAGFEQRDGHRIYKYKAFDS